MYKEIGKSITKNRKFLISVVAFFVLIVLTILSYLTKKPILGLYSFWFAGILAIVIEYKCLIVVVQLTRIHFTKKDIVKVIVAVIGCFFVYLILLKIKDSIYVWDSVGYYRMMESLLQQFQIHSLAGFSEWFLSGLVYDYGNFLQIFIYPFYALSTHSLEAYIMSYYIGAVIPVIVSMYITAIVILNRVASDEVHQLERVKTVVLIVLVSFPLLHGAAINGQPDVKGLTFVGMIVSLTINYDFEDKDKKRWMLLLLATIALILTRRWYLFFVVGYYFSYVLVILGELLISKNFEQFRTTFLNILLFGLSSIIICVVVLYKMVVRILGESYSETYAAWNRGGLLYESQNQIEFLGIFVSIIVIAGLIYGLLDVSSRKNTVMMLGAYLTEIFLFTKIQNAGYHQSLIFVPFYLYGIYLFLCAAVKQRYHVSRIGGIVTIILLSSFINCSCFPFENNIGDNLFGKVDIYPEKRSDLVEIASLVDFLQKRADTDSKVMFLAGSDTYDCSTFINFPTPGRNDDIFVATNYYAASGGFPAAYLTAKYLVVIDPIQQREAIITEGVLAILKNVLANDKTKFVSVKSFELTNGVVATVYERVVPYDNDEVTMLMDSFYYYCEQYPELFNNRLRSFLVN